MGLNLSPLKSGAKDSSRVRTKTIIIQFAVLKSPNKL